MEETSMMEAAALVAWSLLGLVTIVGIFKTKTAGWGRYSSSTLILTLALFLSPVLLILGKLESPAFANILFAIVGYAGGLIASNKAEG